MSYFSIEYLNHKKKLEYTSIRIREMRGDLPFGVHVLCPLSDKNKFECENKFGWFLYSKQYVAKIRQVIIEKMPDDYLIVKRKPQEYLNEYLKKVNIFQK